MLNLSEVLLQKQHELTSFAELLAEIERIAKTTDERFFRMDIRPPFADTPDNWEDRLESAFY